MTSDTGASHQCRGEPGASTLNAGFDLDPEGYNARRRCWLNDRRTRFLVDRLAQWDTGGSHRVLELGSGTGWLLARLAGRFPHWSFVGLEPNARYVDYALSRYGARNLAFLIGAAETPPAGLDTGPFDLLLSNDALHHVYSQQETVRQAALLAAPGGHWIAIEPNALNPYAFAGQALKSGERNFWPRRFLAFATGAGWCLERKGYLFLIPPLISAPPPWLKGLERRLERVPVLAGGVAITLRLAGPISASRGPGPETIGSPGIS